MTPQGPIGRRAAGGLQGLAVASQRILERAPGFRTASQRAEGLSRADQAAGPPPGSPNSSAWRSPLASV